MTLQWKIFGAFGLVLLVVLGLGLWSHQATSSLQRVNEMLLNHGVPAVRLELGLGQQIHALRRHETRYLVLDDPTYQALFRQETHAFRAAMQGLSVFVSDAETRNTLDRVGTRFAEYLRLVEDEWAAVARGERQEALRISDGPARDAANTLTVSVDVLLGQSQAVLEREVRAAGRLEGAARLATLLGLAVSVAVGLGVAAMVAIRIARPIRALRDATVLVARGEYDVPITASGRDEVAHLTRAFREMAEKLREAETLKAELFSNISHDFRSPLTSIQMASQLLRSDPLTEKQARWCALIYADSMKLLRLTNQILDLSKLRSGLLALEVERTSLQSIVDSAVEELRPLAHHKGVALMVNLPGPGPTIVCDGDRIQQVLANLLSNAVKFTQRGGQVLVSCKVAPEEIVLTVEDTGIGIPATQLPYVFERYRQAHGGRGGTGLGLAIVRGFVEAHGGRVWVESREGEGSQFHVALPQTWAPR